MKPILILLACLVCAGESFALPPCPEEQTTVFDNCFGTKEYPNDISGHKDKYVWEFKDGKKHGLGTVTSAYGTKYIGEWRQGREWNGTLSIKNGEVLSTFVEGVEMEK